MTNFENKERNRYYGLRIGDLVTINMGMSGSKPLNAEVIEYGFFDNNRVYLKLEDGSEISWVAEWCTLITKVENR
jgi:hypothetical protein